MTVDADVALTAPSRSLPPSPTPAVTHAIESVDARRRAVALAVFWLALALVVLVSMAEVDRLISAAIGENGTSHSLSSVLGPLAFTGGGAWSAWASSALGLDIARWIIVHTILDAIFVVCYFAILRRFIRRWTYPTPNGQSPSEMFLWTLVATEGVEAVALMFGAGFVSDGGPEVAVVLIEQVVMVAALGKWVVCALLVTAILRNVGTKLAARRIWIRSWQAIWIHRLSAVVVAMLFVLACIPKDGVLDQLPDIERQWLGVPFAWGHAIASGLSILLAAIAAFALGRARTRRAVARYVDNTPTAKDEVHNTIRWWLVPPLAWLLVACLAGVLTFLGSRDKAWPFGWSAVVYLLVSGLILGISIWFRDRDWPNKELHPDPRRGMYAWIVGDLLAVAIIVVGGVGLVRSMAAPVFIGPAFADPTLWIEALAVLIIGAIISVLAPLLLLGVTRGSPWPGMRSLVHRNDPAESRNAKYYTFLPHVRSLIIIVCTAIALLCLMAIFPVQSAAIVGPVALTVLILTAWTALLGAFTVALQDYQPLAVFRVMRLKATPVLTLALVLPLAYGAALVSLGADPTVHAVRQVNSAQVTSLAAVDDTSTATTLQERIGELDCKVIIGGESVQPVVLVAAEGGGIRAAYWTARAMESLRANHPCIAESVLVSSGVSGGSVGLVLTATSAISDKSAPQPATDGDQPEAILDTWHDFTGPDVVGSAAAALLTGDVAASALGIRLPNYYPDKGFTWRDRAALIETGWIDAADVLQSGYDPGANDRVGFLLLNSTDTSSGCRVIVGMNVFGEASEGPDCKNVADGPATSWWLGSQCLRSLDWASAAMLSGRFPVITPAGQMPTAAGCPQGAQLIDGGYSEGTGLGTIADLSPAIMSAIREANAQADQATHVLPILLYLRNSSGYDLADPVGEITAEPLVPLVGRTAGAQQVADATWLQRISTAFVEACPENDNPCNKALERARDNFGGGAVVVSPATIPTVVPPLGWALSTYSTESLDQALKAEATCSKYRPKGIGGAARLCDF